MLFHLGALWRLNELGYLPKLARVSSVSGGSITAGVLGMHWKALGFDAKGVGQNFPQAVVDPIRKLAGITIDQWSIIGHARAGLDQRQGGRRPEASSGQRPRTSHEGPIPRFILNATNAVSALWHFSKPTRRLAGQDGSAQDRPGVAVAGLLAFHFIPPGHLDLKPGA
jgi:NTE family protein